MKPDDVCPMYHKDEPVDTGYVPLVTLMTGGSDD